ncbi:hypothetical protein [Desulfonatronum thioautotrophicum]|uniref:hypothetical protein n=1 Tax=Desulfonatronum thioautotrophicum TaxID=617001 RepID=UPI0005EB2A95|nr:hypothetical protein [Desulfonatronum thioautotrophicum]
MRLLSFRPFLSLATVTLLFTMALAFMTLPGLNQGARAEQVVDTAETPVFIPPNIAGMALINLIDGDEAATIIDRMHRGNVATQANFIAMYQGLDASATYYVSLYDDPQQALLDKVEMAEIMAREDHGFSHLMRRTKNDMVFYMALGQGQAHYFFARNNELIWLAVDIGMAEKALEDVLHQ